MAKEQLEDKFVLNFNEDAVEETIYPKLPEGTHPVAFCAIQDIGPHKGAFDDVAKPKYVMWFQTELTDSDQEGVQQVFRLRSKPLLASTHPKSNLIAYLEAVMGGSVDEDLVGEEGVITAEELAEKLVGNNVNATIVHSDDGKWANIKSISPSTKKARYDVSADGFEIPVKKDKNADEAAA